MTLSDLTQVAQTGLSGVLLVILNALWQETKVSNAFTRQMLLDASNDRETIKQNLAIQQSLKTPQPPFTAAQ